MQCFTARCTPVRRVAPAVSVAPRPQLVYTSPSCSFLGGEQQLRMQFQEYTCGPRIAAAMGCEGHWMAAYELQAVVLL
jgi:hypothetical protein